MSNITQFENLTDPMSIIAGVDSASGNLISVFLLFTITVITIVIMTKTEGFRSGITAGGFVGVIAGVILFQTGLMPLAYIAYPLALFAIGLMIMILSKD